ncbi:MAG: hypothetical protein DI537_43645 [Stutzerimonas stutzeri]|nr:MAG: hypothetical protein DI537_43645 [Stutzerimonas stutzeri]
MKPDLVFTEIMAKLDRAAINGTKLHLDTEHVRALARSEAYAVLAGLKAKEIAARWDDPNQSPQMTPAASNSGRSGSGTAPIATIGASAGTMTEQEREAVGRAASQRALAAVQAAAPRRKHKTPSSPITSNRDGR